MFSTDDLIDEHANEFKKTFNDALKKTQNEVDTEQLYELVKLIDTNKIMKAIPFLWLDKFIPVIKNTITNSANETERSNLKIKLNVDRETTLQEVDRISSNLITLITDEQRLTIKYLLNYGIKNGHSFVTIAEKIKSYIGLNAQQAKTINSMIEYLNVNGATGAVINKAIELRIKKMIRLRSETIALTESARSVCSGRYLIQQQMYQDGDMSPNSMQEWLTGRDERACRICGLMNGQKVKMNEYFKTGSGALVRSPILHPRCRCIVVVNY